VTAGALTEPSHPLFAPLAYRLAGRLAGIEWSELAAEPAAASHAIRDLQRALGTVPVTSQIRLGFEAEACGADLGRDDEGIAVGLVEPIDPPSDAARFLTAPLVTTALDLTRRLSGELPGTAAVIGVMTGPRTLAPMFTETDQLASLYAALFRGYAEAGAAAVLAVEAPAAGPGTAADLEPLRPTLNVAAYFGVPIGIVDSGLEKRPAGWAWAFGREELIAPELLRRDPLEADQPPAAPVSRPLVMSAGEVDPDTPLERLIAWRDRIEQSELRKE
jgi:hypothetical protein